MNENEEFETIEDIDIETEKFIAKYAIAYTAILKLLQQQIDEGLSERQSKGIVSKITSILTILNKDAKSYAKTVFPQYYSLSLKNIDSTAIDISGVKKISGAKHAIHQQALKQAINGLYGDLSKNTRYMEREAKKIIRSNAQELIVGMIEGGESYITVKKKLKDHLIENGVSSFFDAGRKQWTIERYADMVIRTKSRQLHNEGAINRLKEYQEKYAKEDEYDESFDLIQISKHGAGDWCRYYEGKVFSISGKNKFYPSIETLPNRPYNTLHPNCKHIFLAYISSLRGQGETVDKKFQSLSMSEINKIDYEARKK